jgi:ankyrin repeat protein
MYHPRLRQQFLRDLDDLGKLSSPLIERDARFCPTNIASMTVAEYHICTNNLGLAYNHVVRAAERNSVHAQAVVAQLEPYHGSFDVPIDIGDYPVELETKTGKPPARALKWAFSAACLGSLSALQLLKLHQEDDYEAALRTVRSSRLGGIQSLSLWTSGDVHYSKEKGQLMAAPESREQLMFDVHLMLDSLNAWVVEGPKIGIEISALHVASAKGLPLAIQKLLERGADVNSQMCPEGCTPLLLASISGSLEAAQVLMKNGADATIKNEGNETPLHWLSSFEEDQVLPASKLLFQNKSQLSVLANGAGMESEGFENELAMTSGTPLHRAIGRRNIHAVRSLLDLGADPLSLNQHGLTAFGLATQLHLASIMKLLHSRMNPYKPNQDHGPNLRLFNFAINSARPLALFEIHRDRWLDNAKRTLVMLLDFGESLYGYGGEDNFINNTIAIGNHCMAKVLLENGATEYMEKRELQFGDSTALQAALELGQRYIFMELLKHGASVQTQLLPAKLRIPGTQIFPDERHDRSSYLHFCAETGSDVFFVREFIRRGLLVNQPDSEWRTPLYLALKGGHLEIASELLKHGAKLDEVRDGLTLLGQLAEEGFSIPKERFQWLLSQKAGNEAVGFLAGPRHRQSIFHLLAQDKRMIRQPLWARELIAFFLEQVSDSRLLDLQDVRLNTALHLGVQSQNLEIVSALLDAGAKVHLTNVDGKTPLRIARESSGAKGQDIVKLLELHGASLREEPHQGASDMESLMSRWKELGFQEQLIGWLDTALVSILQELRQTLLDLFRSDGFLVQENPWKSATKAVWDFIYSHSAITANGERIRQFEYAVGEMLQGFVDAVTVKTDGNNLIIKLVKPLDRRARRFPPNLLNELITYAAFTPSVGQASFHAKSVTSDENSQSIESKPPRKTHWTAPKTDASNEPSENFMEEEPENMFESPSRKWIRLRRLDEGRFIIEKHDLAKDGLNVGSDTGIMVLGDDTDMIRESMVEKLADETVVEIIDTTDDALTHRATSVARLKTLAVALEEYKRSGPLIPPQFGRLPGSAAATDHPRSSSRRRPITRLQRRLPSPSPSPPSPPPPTASASIPKIGPRTDLSAAEKARLSKLLQSSESHTITRGDELGLLLFNYPIPEDVWISVSVLPGVSMGIAFPCRHDNKGNPVKSMDEATARLAKGFTLTFEL